MENVLNLYNPPKPQVPIHFDSLTLEKEWFCRHKDNVCAEHSVRIPSETPVSFRKKSLLAFFFGIPFYLESFLLRQN